MAELFHITDELERIGEAANPLSWRFHFTELIFKYYKKVQLLLMTI
ncbi:hypothetical protein [Pedobacter sp. JCM 36344]